MGDCVLIEPVVFLVLALTSGRESISLSSLRKARDAATDALDGAVFIEWTRAAVMGAFELFPDVLKYIDGRAAWAGDDKAAARRLVLEGLPDDMGIRLAEAVGKAMEEHGKTGR